MTAKNNQNQISLPQELSVLSHKLLRQLHYPGFLPKFFGDLAEQFRETHISLVVIGPTIVLKLKKPLNLGFLNYQTLDARWRCAVQEIELNSRLSKGIYLGLLPLLNEFSQETPLLRGPFSATPPKDCIDVAVVMKRIPDSALLSSLLEQNAVTVDKHLHPLTERLVGFHREQIAHTVEKAVLYADISTACFDNFHEIRALLGKESPLGMLEALNGVESYTNDFLGHSRDLLWQRASVGLVVDGHGDLRAEHVAFFEQTVSIIDCIEFSESLRFVDVLSDLAFLCMDLHYLHRPDFSLMLAKMYQAALPAAFDAEVFRFFLAYRAMVRAKVELLKLQQGNLNGHQSLAKGLDRAAAYVGLAHRYAIRLDAPFLLAIGGPMGVGKSTTANFFKALTNCCLFQSDAIRKEIFKPTSAAQEEQYRELPYATGIYSQEATDKTYAELFHRAEKSLKDGEAVILDASFTTRQQRARAFQVANQADVPFIFVWGDLTEELQYLRLNARENAGDSLSDGRQALVGKQRETLVLPGEEGFPSATLDMRLSPAEQGEEVLARVFSAFKVRQQH